MGYDFSEALKEQYKVSELWMDKFANLREEHSALRDQNARLLAFVERVASATRRLDYYNDGSGELHALAESARSLLATVAGSGSERGEE